jgi:hypothetical protein
VGDRRTEKQSGTDSHYLFNWSAKGECGLKRFGLSAQRPHPSTGTTRFSMM